MTEYLHKWTNSWAKYYGADLGGWIFEFSNRPNRGQELWYAEDGQTKCTNLIDLDEPGDWKELYRERPV
jgi:hypothetical protein